MKKGGRGGTCLGFSLEGGKVHFRSGGNFARIPEDWGVKIGPGKSTFLECLVPFPGEKARKFQP